MSTTTGQWEARMVALEQEQSVLGALLRNNNAVDALGDLKAEHFYSLTHRAIFKAIMQLLMANQPADVITVYDKLQSQGLEAADLRYLNAMLQSTPSAANIRRYVAIVRDRAIKRGLVEMAHEAIDVAQHSPKDASELVDDFSTRLEKLAQISEHGEPELAADSITAHVAMIDEMYHGADSRAVSTGLTDLDIALGGGMRPGWLVVVAGRPKMGKTALALNITNHAAREGVASVLSLEMTKPELHNRNLASIGQIPLAHLNDPKLMGEEDWSRFTGAIEKISKLHLYLDDEAGLTLFKVAAKAKQVKRKVGRLDLLVIDYLQLMNGPGDNRNAQIETITRGLKNLGKELGCPVLLLSQLNRELEKRPNKRPQPSDLRDSGSIEQDADAVILLYRDEVYNSDTRDKGICEANLALFRHGPTKVVPLLYVGEHVRFENAPRSWHPPVLQTPPAPARRGFD
jgi:replicative DNA helicase